MWREWNRFAKEAQELKESLGAKLYAVFNGDVTDGDHHDTSQIITRNPATMVRLAALALKPITDVADECIFIRGTASHVGNSGSSEELIADDLQGWEKDGVRSHWSLYANFGGVIVQFAHHAGMGRLPWTAKNAANRVASKALFACAEQGMKLPDLIFRSHNHRWSDSYDNYPCRAICLPAWQLKTEYVHRIDSTAVPHIGGVFVVIRPGEGYEIRKFKVDIETPRPIKF